jgi:hypothetical protein
MATVAELYVNSVKRKLNNYYAAWLPNETLSLGDVGILDGSFFRRVTSLSDRSLEIPFDRLEDADPTPFNYVSESGVSLRFKAAGELNAKLLPNVPEGKAGIGVEFGRQGAFIIKAPETYEPAIKNIAKLEEDILQAYRKGNWKPDWVVIVKIVEAPIATILISNSSESKLEFAVEGDVSAGPIDLGNANLEFELKSQNGDVIQMIKAKKVTPFFQLARIKTHWWWPDPSVSYGIRALNSGQSDIPANSRGINLPAPETVKNDPEAARCLYLGLVSDSDPVVITLQ